MHINCSGLCEEKGIDLNDFKNEVDSAYEQFKLDFIESYLTFNGMPIRVRKYPIDEISHRYETFNHITSKDYYHIQCNSSDYDNRLPDIRRLERIKWVRLLIEHPRCIPSSDCDCRGTFTWYEPYKNTYRVNILHYDERYKVVLEKRHNKDYYLLITAYYFDNEVVRDKKYKKDKKDKKNPYVPNSL